MNIPTRTVTHKLYRGAHTAIISITPWGAPLHQFTLLVRMDNGLNWDVVSEETFPCYEMAADAANAQWIGFKLTGFSARPAGTATAAAAPVYAYAGS